MPLGTTAAGPLLVGSKSLRVSATNDLTPPPPVTTGIQKEVYKKGYLFDSHLEIICIHVADVSIDDFPLVEEDQRRQRLDLET